jgi:hypothetical protein
MKNTVTYNWNQDAEIRVELYFLHTIIYCDVRNRSEVEWAPHPKWIEENKNKYGL